MSQTFYRFGKAPFDANRSEGELLTDNIEEEYEYDALNDETFGDGALDGDWEDNHEKLAGFMHKSHSSSDGEFQAKIFQDEGLEDDFDEKLGRSKEIVEQTISQLGLEDDLDDPAVMSRGRSSCNPPRPLNSFFGPSAPPPAILDAEECGSPKTQTIWSTSATQFTSTPLKGSQLNQLLQNLQVKSSDSPYQTQQIPPFAGSCLAAKAPVPISSARKLEEIERDLLGKGSGSLSSDWSSPPKAMTAEQVEKELLGTFSASELVSREQLLSDGFQKSAWKSPSPRHTTKNRWMCSTPPLPVSGNMRSLNDIENDILLRPRAHTVDEVERGMRPVPPPGFIGGNRQPPIGTPPQGGGMMSMANHQLRSSPVPIVSLSSHSLPVVMGSHLSSGLLPHPVLNPGGRGLGAVGLGPNTFGNFNKNVFPFGVHGPCGLSGMNPPASAMKNHFYPGSVAPHKSDHLNGRYRDADDYVGIMTQKEKEWLIRIQMLQLHTDNPYVDDFYNTTHTIRKMTRERSKSVCEEEDDDDDDDQVKLIVPEKSKQESKTYVPLQFEGSLGKLQAVSVNFPRRILDVHHMSTEEESRMPANKELHKQRRLLLDIEKLYTVFLNVDDEEKRMQALPEEAQGPHRENRDALIEKLFQALFCSNGEERFVQIASVRKGRHLIMRSLPLFGRDQQLTAYSALYGNIGFIMRRDHIDQVMPQYLRMVKKMIAQCTFEELVKLAVSLQGETAGGVSISREWSFYLAAFQTKFVLSSLCNMIKKAEQIMKAEIPIRNDLQSHWTNFIVHIVNALCLIKESPLKPPDSPPIDILQHIRRYPIAEDKLEVLNEKLKLFVIN